MNKYFAIILFLFLSFNATSQININKLEDNRCAQRFNGLLWSCRDGLIDPSDIDAMMHARFVSHEKPRPMTLSEFYDSSIPYGWRLPTKHEFIQALKQAKGIHISTDSNLAYIPLVQNILHLGIERTVGQWGSHRALGGTLRYLVKEGVVTLKFSRGIEDYVNGIAIIADENSMYYIVDEYVEFSDSWSTSARVRLVRDL